MAIYTKNYIRYRDGVSSLQFSYDLDKSLGLERDLMDFLRRVFIENTDRNLDLLKLSNISERYYDNSLHLEIKMDSSDSTADGSTKFWIDIEVDSEQHHTNWKIEVSDGYSSVYSSRMIKTLYEDCKAYVKNDAIDTLESLASSKFKVGINDPKVDDEEFDSFLDAVQFLRENV